MAIRPLSNADWGFESNCFVCEPGNAQGLQLRFAHHEEAGTVVAGFSLGDAFSGAPSYVHGGVLLAILDEAMCWATIAVAGVFALTRTTQTSFHRPVRVGSSYQVEARVDRADPKLVETSGRILDAAGDPCAEATATFVVMSLAQATSAIGGRVSPDESGFTRG